MKIDLNNKVAQFDLIEPSEQCPEDEDNVLIITKHGNVTIGQYVAVDENVVEWINNDSLSEDHFFCQDDVMFWANMSNCEPSADLSDQSEILGLWKCLTPDQKTAIKDFIKSFIKNGVA